MYTLHSHNVYFLTQPTKTKGDFIVRKKYKRKSKNPIRSAMAKAEWELRGAEWQEEFHQRGTRASLRSRTLQEKRAHCEYMRQCYKEKLARRRQEEEAKHREAIKLAQEVYGDPYADLGADVAINAFSGAKTQAKNDDK
jgi:hypothetical protein